MKASTHSYQIRVIRKKYILYIRIIKNDKNKSY